MASQRCKICGSDGSLLARAVVMKRHEASYRRCNKCAFTWVDSPHWLDEAYATPIVPIDLGPVNRCMEASEIVRALLVTHFSAWKRYVDYGAGHGLFVRRMRDLGFDFRYYDRYPSNIFAQGFEVENTGGCELLTAFEVFEHLVDPVSGLNEMLKFAPNVFFTTLLLPETRPGPNEWWYYLLDQGQHVSIFTRESLEFLGQKFGLNFVSDGSRFHALTTNKISPSLFRAATRPLSRVLLGEVGSRLRGVRSKLPDDFAESAGFRYG